MTAPAGNKIVTHPAEIAIQSVEARCLGIPYCSQQQQEIYDVSGRVIGNSSVMPSIYIRNKISQMREAPSLNLSQRYERLKKAGQLYKEATLAELDPNTYITLTSKVTGLQPLVIANSLANISYALLNMSNILQAATPTGAVWDCNNAAVYAGCSLFSRRADVVSVIAAGNGPGAHGLWPQAIAMGYRTLVRPSYREPFTAQRLVHALEQAGLADYIALVPTDHQGTDVLISQSDLAIVYGGPEVAARYRHNPRVLIQGPGRSKIVVGRDIDHAEAVRFAAGSALSLGGAACVSTSAILVEENPNKFARELREALEALSTTAPPRLAGQQEANHYEALLKSEEFPWHYDRTFAQGYPLKPHVTLVQDASDPKVQRELSFPCVTVAPFNQQDAYKALSNSLVVTILSRQENMIKKILADTSIANVYIGNIMTTWMGYHVPHSGYLTDFLMCNRGIRIKEGWLDIYRLS